MSILLAILLAQSPEDLIAKLKSKDPVEAVNAKEALAQLDGARDISSPPPPECDA